jgi:hypothetical protein
LTYSRCRTSFRRSALLESRGHIDRDDARSTSSGVAWGCGRHVEDDDVDDDGIARTSSSSLSSGAANDDDVDDDIGDDDDDEEEEEARCQRW